MIPGHPAHRFNSWKAVVAPTVVRKRTLVVGTAVAALLTLGTAGVSNASDDCTPADAYTETVIVTKVDHRRHARRSARPARTEAADRLAALLVDRWLATAEPDRPPDATPRRATSGNAPRAPTSVLARGIRAYARPVRPWPRRLRTGAPVTPRVRRFPVSRLRVRGGDLPRLGHEAASSQHARAP